MPLSSAPSSVDKTYSPENLTEMKNKDYHQSSQFDISIPLPSSCDPNQPLNIEKHSHEPSRFIVNKSLGIVNDGLPRPKANSPRPIVNEGLGIVSEGVPRSNDDGEQPAGIRYPPSWESIPPTEILPPPGSSDCEENVSSQNKLDNNALISS